MKPLTEWTTEELTAEMVRYTVIRGNHLRRDMLAELLRRERERCAKECEAVADDHWATSESEQAAKQIAARIRGLQ